VAYTLLSRNAQALKPRAGAEILTLAAIEAAAQDRRMAIRISLTYCGEFSSSDFLSKQLKRNTKISNGEFM
jgi:hypothetical protein